MMRVQLFVLDVSMLRECNGSALLVLGAGEV